MSSTAPRVDLLGLTFQEFFRWSSGLVGFSERFHRDLYRRLLRDGRWAPAESPLWQEAELGRPGTIAQLTAAAVADHLPQVSGSRTVEDPEHGVTSKLLLRLADGAEIEAVLIPMGVAGRDAHHTICVSSQVGCRMGCSFCHTAKMGLVRQLAAHEIVAQVIAMQRATGVMPRNVVFMGMGEPLDNLDAVAATVRVLTDQGGLRLRHRHVTVSTVGRVDALARWESAGLAQVNLAVSLTAADDALRSELMPINRLHPLVELKRALQAIPLRPGRRILVSCVVIPGVTDSEAQAQNLIRWLADLPVLVNLIPYNPIPSRAWRAPTSEEVAALLAQLDRAGIPVRVRSTKGDAVMAACGQLGNRQPRTTAR